VMMQCCVEDGTVVLIFLFVGREYLCE
jgi:hypothetical protein